MAAAVERIVVQATPQEKKAIAAKAKRLGLPVSELMRRGAAAYRPAHAHEELGALADAARVAAERAGDSIDDAFQFVDASNGRIASLEAAAKRTRRARPGGERHRWRVWEALTPIIALMSARDAFALVNLFRNKLWSCSEHDAFFSHHGRFRRTKEKICLMLVVRATPQFDIAG